MAERKYQSFTLPIPHFSPNLIFNPDEYDFYKIKHKEGHKASPNGNKVKKGANESVEGSPKNRNGSDNERGSRSWSGSESGEESENEKVFMRYLKNIGKRDVSKRGDNQGSKSSPCSRDSGKDSSSVAKDQPGGNSNELGVVRKKVHLFEKYPHITIKEELKMEWLYHMVPKSFVTRRVNISAFEEECRRVRERLKVRPCHVRTEVDEEEEEGEEEKEEEGEEEKEEEKEEEEEEEGEEEGEEEKDEEEEEEKEEARKEEARKEEEEGDNKRDETDDAGEETAARAKSKIYSRLIRVLLSGVRTPSVEEIINHIVYHNCNNWQYKIDMEVLKKVADTEKTRKVLNRTKCYLDWLPKMESNPFSKYEIIAKLKEKTISKTFKLVCDFNNTILKSLYINQNVINIFYTLTEYPTYAKDSLKNLSSETIFIISVSFYHPIRGIKIAEYDILSNQTLAHLTDVFFCFDTSNYGFPKFAGSLYYIDGILYPDLRKKEALDYSTCILNFYKKMKNNDFVRPPYKIPQHKATLRDIEIPLYERCCFLHQGNCEHRVVFTNVRQHNSYRDKEFSQYPLRTFKPNITRKFCTCCHKNEAKKIVLDCYLLKENPSYVCNGCFDLFLLNESGDFVDPSMKHFDYINDV
ncbi:snRNA-activating protein complex subunit 3, putative [Plasmodium ovale wallikeri]|uniref:snRNA-activating protein complex subunit 3, putative n=1 Tax=Plasmodium ovale wallikeri TaxID=864142 RepID=A0A1A8ZFB8_PLAOA|nr:snRNA-activating protein complex subunit 3, putative [Plasmodium ovale wallikeri]SBT44834.1 snRNA-activating protein complex subunit 3, putative [Plasmodium ovale wallikeri]